MRVGDETLSVMEIWGAEYQENDAILIKPGDRALLQSICDRERCIMQVGRAGKGVGLGLGFDSGHFHPTPVPQATLHYTTPRR